MLQEILKEVEHIKRVLRFIVDNDNKKISVLQADSLVKELTDQYGIVFQQHRNKMVYCYVEHSDNDKVHAYGYNVLDMLLTHCEFTATNDMHTDNIDIESYILEYRINSIKE